MEKRISRMSCLFVLFASSLTLFFLYYAFAKQSLAAEQSCPSGTLVNPYTGGGNSTCVDIDGDGYGNPAGTACATPEEDCNDSNLDMNPGFREIAPSCEGDFDGDGDIDNSDLAIFTADFGRTDCGGHCEGDCDNDGDVDGSDLAIFANDFGRNDCFLRTCNIIAHRGNSSFSPQNTLASIRAASGRADLVEFDVHETYDFELILMHDDKVDSTTDGTGDVADMTLAEIQELDAGSWFSPAYADEHPPTLLKAVRTSLAEGLTPLIERKTGDAYEYVTALAGLESKVVIQSFDERFLRKVNALNPGFKLGWLVDKPFHPDCITTALEAGASVMGWNYQYINEESHVQAVHNAGLKLYVWTVDDPGEIKKYVDLGVDGVITNYPLAATQLVRPLVPHPEGLIAHWAFEEGSGHGVREPVNRAVGKSTQTTWNDSGPQGDKALRFDGVDDYVMIDASAPLLDPGTNCLTIAAWIKLDKLPGELDEKYEKYASIYDSIEDSYILYLDNTEKKLRFKVTDSDGRTGRPGIQDSALDTTSWHLITGVYEGTVGKARIYLDGVLKDEENLSSGETAHVKPGQHAAIGRNGSGDPKLPDYPNESKNCQYYFEGSVGDIRIWDRALTSEEIAALFSSP